MANAKDGGSMTYYSNRFNIPSMTGTTPAAEADAAADISGTSDVPETVNQVSNAAPAGAASAPPEAGAYTIAYTLQTGLTKYAPMQKIPPTKITVKNFTPLYPTSAFSLATAFLPNPKQLTTLTQSQTFSVSSMENTVSPREPHHQDQYPNPLSQAAAQAGPTGSSDMAKFLARWKD